MISLNCLARPEKLIGNEYCGKSDVPLGSDAPVHQALSERTR